MKTSLLTLLLLAPVVHAQVTTLTYEGSLMTGTSTSISSDMPGVITTIPAQASYDVKLTVDGSVAADNLSIQDLSIEFDQKNFSGVGGADIVETFYQGFGYFDIPQQGFIQLTASDGALTGALIDFHNGEHDPSTFEYALGAGGDFFNYVYGDINYGTCLNVASGGPGPTSVNPCSVNIAGASGKWTVQAPELDSNSTMTAMTLLLGSLIVARGRIQCLRSSTTV